MTDIHINPIADLPTSEEIEHQQSTQNDAEMHALEQRYRIHAEDEYERPEYTIEQNGKGFAPKGNIHALMAEMKHGKTFVNMTLAAAVLMNDSEDNKGNVVEHTFMGLHGLLHDAKVVFFDTEMDRADGQLIQRRVHYVEGWDWHKDNERFTVYHLREIPFSERRTFIRWAIEWAKPDVVFIDGIRDLLQDFNNLDESADLIQELMTISSQFNCSIWTVLHVNPFSEKMRGHLGTELGNKVTDVFRVVKNVDSTTGKVTFKVSHVAARHRDVDGWTFSIDDDKPFGIPTLLSKDEENEQAMDKAAELRMHMESAMPGLKAYSQRAIRDELKKQLSIGSRRADAMISDALALKILETCNTPHGARYRVKMAVNSQSEAMQEECPF